MLPLLANRPAGPPYVPLVSYAHPLPSFLVLVKYRGNIAPVSIRDRGEVTVIDDIDGELNRDSPGGI
jgi:hypothetical protein